MSKVRKLASQTLIYGGSTILGRLLNFALIPLFTWLLNNTSDLGIINILYSYIALFNVLCAMGMETTYFFYGSKTDEQKAFRNGLGIIMMSAVPISLLIFLGANWLEGVVYTGNPWYYRMIAGMLLFDALAILPFAQLRLQNKAKKFALLKFLNIVLNVGFNIAFLYACQKLSDSESLGAYFNPDRKVFFIFLSNLLASAITLLILVSALLKNPPQLSSLHVKPMLKYSWPLIVVGLAAVVNETLDKPLLEYLLPLSFEEARGQIGIYGSVYRLSIAMALVVQAFKFAAEPFFFSIQKDDDARSTYALVLKWFVIAECLVFLAVALNLDLILLILEPAYRVGKPVVPVVLMAQMCLGIYYNLSIWYKLTEKTIWGLYMSLAGVGITIFVNVQLVPVIGYMGAALATLSCYASMMLMSFIIGRKHYKVPYQYSRVALYLALAVVFWLIFNGAGLEGYTQQIIVSILLIVLFGAVVWSLEKPKNLILLRK